MECLSHVMRAMMCNLVKDQLQTGKASVGSQPKEIKYITRSISGRISHLYRLVLENNEGNPTGAKAEIDAIPFHVGANNNNASYNHRLCPYVKNSWCNYQRALFDKHPLPDHSDYL